MSSSIRQRHPAQQPTEATQPIFKGKAISLGKGNQLLSWEEIPEWSKDNEYIHSRYRPICDSYLSCLRSCFYVHNETGNIYSHLLATLWMVALPFFFFPLAKERYSKANADDWTVFGLFFLGGAICFGLSTIYHTFSNHSHAVHDVYLRLDLFGISFVTAGCFPPGLWYTFPCTPRATKMFWISVSSVPPQFSTEFQPDIDGLVC